MNLRHHSIIAAVAALGVTFAAGQAAAAGRAIPKIEYVPASSNPPVPAGLKVTCLRHPDQLQLSKTCPVVKYQGITTWAYSYRDNRLAMALVGYDKHNRVVRDVEKRGARYVFSALSSKHTKTVIFFGQAKHRVAVPWAELGIK